MKHLSLTDSSVLKGIAILMMLWHHAFLNATLFNDFVVAGHGLCYYLALLCKLCVAVFVFLSGYGLMTKYKDAEHISIGKFYRGRFVKLMMNYWFIWLIFVLLSLLWLGDRPLGWEYFGFPVKVGAVLEFLGILQCADWQAYPYNPVWWYYSCVIGLYLLFPLLRWLVRRSVSFTIILSVALYFLPGPFHVVRMYVPLFVAGMLYVVFDSRNASNSTPPHWTWAVLLVVMLLSRFALGGVQEAYDALILFAGVVVYQSFRVADKVKRLLALFGKYSMDMFLTHTFLLTLWPSTHSMVYATRNPLIIYLTLLAMSLLLAVLLGKAKELTGFNRLIERLRK